MTQFVLSSIMDAIADTCLASPNPITDRAYAWPVAAVNPPCVVVGYPKKIDFDMTFKRGADSAIFPVWYVVGKADDKAARDELSKIITGAVSIKAKLDGTLGGVVSTARVVDCEVEMLTVGEIPYLAALFTLDVVT